MNPVADLLTIFRAYLAARSDAPLQRFADGFDWQIGPMPPCLSRLSTRSRLAWCCKAAARLALMSLAWRAAMGAFLGVVARLKAPYDLLRDQRSGI